MRPQPYHQAFTKWQHQILCRRHEAGAKHRCRQNRPLVAAYRRTPKIPHVREA